jgi:hypothetical protein
MEGKQTRRKVLQKLGISAGAVSGSIPAFSVRAAAENDSLSNAPMPFVMLDIQIRDPPQESAREVGCVENPSLRTRSGDFDPQTTDRVYITQMEGGRVELGGDGSIVASPFGIHQVSDREAISVGKVPDRATPLTGGTYISEIPNPDITIEATPGRGEIRLADQEVSVTRGDTATVSTSISYTLTVGTGEEEREIEGEGTIELAATHYGTPEFIGHPQHMVVPRTEEARQLVDQYREQAQSNTQNENQQRGPPHRVPSAVVEHSDLDAYVIEFSNAGGS